MGYADKLADGFAMMGKDGDDVILPAALRGEVEALADFNESGLSVFDNLGDDAEPLDAVTAARQTRMFAN